MNQTRSRLFTAIFQLARELPPAVLDALAEELESTPAGRTGIDLGHFGTSHKTKERISELAALLAANPNIDHRAAALAIQASADATARVSLEQRVEIAWTGAGTEAVPLRRVDQVLYQLIESAETEVLLVTYAAYKAEHALDILRAATERGVQVTLIIELAEESGGKITFDGLDRIRKRVPRATVLYWPLKRRARSASGAYGAMHVKCLIADRKAALVSSANLTDSALAMNMELGLLVGGIVAARLADHFEQLLLRGELEVVHEGRT
jgi:phosphatidylserine/phosphatidylglycerophosphate/cardiolipin synthase-like enzyme